MPKLKTLRNVAREYARLTADVLKRRPPWRELEITRLRRELTESKADLRRVRTKLRKARLRGEEPRRMDPSQIVWIFATGRSGTTWVKDMFVSMGLSCWEEPMVGRLFGGFWHSSRKNQLTAPNYIISARHKKTWLRSIKNFVLDGATARFPKCTEGGHLVIKEPNGSVGAPLLAEALPESRLLVIVRDPRDVCASHLDSRREGGWYLTRTGTEKSSVDADPDGFVDVVARDYVANLGNAVEAYDAHAGPKTLVYYEDLNVATFDAMLRALRDLGLAEAVSPDNLRQAVEKHSWANVPAEKKGSGKFYRKATPGSWREDLTPEQARIVESRAATLLERFYPPDS